MSRAVPAALSLFAAFVCAGPLLDPDQWWHLAAGRDMLSSGAVPRFETWSWTLAGTPWVDFEWAFQLLMEVLFRAGGFQGLVALKALACGLAVWGVFESCRREDSSVATATLGALLALSAVRLRAHARPELATLLLLPAFLLLARVRCRRPIPLWPSVCLTLLWSNAHGGWPLGPGVFLLCSFGRAWEVRSWRDPAVRDLALWGGICALVSVVNPYGLGAHRVVLGHLLRPPAAAGIEEWLAEGLRHFPAFWLLLAAAAGRLALDLRQDRREALGWLAVLAPLALLGLGGARFAPLFCLAAPAYVFSRSAGLPPARFLRLGPPAACLALALALAWPARHRRWSEPVRWDRFPREALAFLDREGLDGKLFNDYGFGGYIAWAGAGRRKVYYDGRYLFQGLLGREDLSEAALAVIRHRPLMDRGEWALVWFDDAALVYAKRVPGNAALIARHEFRAADPADPEAMLARVREGSLAKADVLAELSSRPCAVSRALAGLVSKI